MQHHLSLPTPYMVDHWPEILPDWTLPPQTIIICLWPSQVPLDVDGPPQRQEKDRLLSQFVTWGQGVMQQPLPPGHDLAIISPQDGKPLFSPAGNTHIDLVATVHHCLGLSFRRTPDGCKVLIHPQWRSAVYPGLAMTTLPRADASLFFHLDPAKSLIFPC